MLTGAQRAELRDLIVEVFDRRALAQALDAAEPSCDFEALVAEGPFNDQVFQLVKLANQQGWVEQLYSFVCAHFPRRHRWDRLPAHRSRLLQEFLCDSEGHIETEYLPGYAPELNPVEYIWGYWKQHELPNVCPKVN